MSPHDERGDLALVRDARARKVVVMLGTNSLVGAQALTFAIPIGTFIVVCLWLFFQRRPNR